MKKIELNFKDKSVPVYAGEEIKNLLKYTEGRNVLLVTDNVIAPIYWPFLPEVEIVEIDAGEAYKTMETVEYLYKEFIDHNIDRNSLVIGFGGGVVLDIVGFAASTFMRGVPFAFMPSTLLAQVDASIGGKNGYNYIGAENFMIKNLIGSVNQPEFILTDYNLLKTLSLDHIANGFAEVIKTALITDPSMFERIEAKSSKLFDLEIEFISEIIPECIEAKGRIVTEDEKESGLRKILNFGHTFGHAIEPLLEAEEGSEHGKAISIGMVKALEISENIKGLDKNLSERVKKVLARIALPIDFKGGEENIIELLGNDKKKNADKIDFILLEAIGKPVIEAIDIEELGKMF